MKKKRQLKLQKLEAMTSIVSIQPVLLSQTVNERIRRMCQDGYPSQANLVRSKEKSRLTREYGWQTLGFEEAAELIVPKFFGYEVSQLKEPLNSIWHATNIAITKFNSYLVISYGLRRDTVMRFFDVERIQVPFSDEFMDRLNEVKKHSVFDAIVLFGQVDKGFALGIIGTTGFNGWAPIESSFYIGSYGLEF